MKKNIYHISQLLKNYKIKHSPKTRIAIIQEIWPQIVGRAVAEKCRPKSEWDGVIRVGCESSVWSQELEYMSTEIVEMLNQRIDGKWVARIKCEVASKQVF